MTTVPLDWRISPAVSWLHAADMVRRGMPLVDPAIPAALGEPVRRLDEALAAAGCDAAGFWDAAIPRSLDVQDAARLVEESFQAATKGESGASPPIAQFADCIADLGRAAHALWPHLAEDLRLRERPLREQWEARGPGLLRRLAQLAGAGLAVGDADVALMQPCLGGGGEIHPAFHLVRLEAVLANPHPALPEPVRLAWLLFRLAAERADQTGGHILPSRRRLIALGAVPLVLEAGEHVEWTQFDPSALEHALDAWRLTAGDPSLCELLLDWRNATRHKSWPEALADLAPQMPMP